MNNNHSPKRQQHKVGSILAHGLALGLAVMAGGLALSVDSHAQSRTLATGSGLQLATGAPDSYTVKQGDTLWDIAKTYLNQPWYWPELWYLNPQVQNPHLIYPGDVLRLVTVDGQTRLTVAERGSAAAGAAAAGNTGGSDRVISGNAVRLSPQMRAQDMGNAINTIPYKEVAAFLGRPGIISAAEVKSGPHLLAPRDPRALGAAGDEFYIADLPDPVINARYNLLHVDQPLKDPESGDVLGYRTMYVGNGPITALSNPPKMRLAETAREALPGDRLVPELYQLNLNFLPHAPTGEVKGAVFGINDGTMAGRYSVVAINRGSKAGIETGHVLSILRAGRAVKDRYADGRAANPTETPSGFLKKTVQLPDERIGTLMVFKTFDTMSYALVMDAEYPVAVGDRIGNP